MKASGFIFLPLAVVLQISLVRYVVQDGEHKAHQNYSSREFCP